MKGNVIGTIGANAEIIQINGREFLKFSVAEREKDTTKWYSVIYGNIKIQSYLTKGTKVAVYGKYQNQLYTDNQGNTKLQETIWAVDIEIIYHAKVKENINPNDIF